MAAITKIAVLFTLLFIGPLSWGQFGNYDRINVQGQLLNPTGTTAEFEFLLLANSGDTLWRESHETVPLTVDGAFSIPFGAGTFIEGGVTDFNAINWLEVDQLELYRIADERYLQGLFKMLSVPYAMEAGHLVIKPNLHDLAGVVNEDHTAGAWLMLKDAGFTIGALGDTVLYAHYAGTANYSDTVWFAYNNDYADSAMYSYWADTTNYAFIISEALTSDSALYADSTNVALVSNGNWRLDGNSGLDDSNYIGPSITDSLLLKTNNNTRLVFANGPSVHNKFPGPGFRFRSNSGALIKPNLDPGVDSIHSSYMYLDGASYSFQGGLQSGAIDTLKGTYSFAWGDHVGTNGTYGVAFGKNTYGDTAIFSGGTPYAAISSFAMGRNCHVTHMGFAVGDSAIAGYYRNIAVGKKVISTTQSAGVAMGNNVLVTGATSWAAGQNLTANGHFSTAMGSNASTNGRTGSFVYGDNSTTDTVGNTANHQFMVRADGGYVFYSSEDLTMGVQLASGGGSWSMISDRNKKKHIQLLQPLSFAPQFESINVFSWMYKGQNDLHIGPMAQDFYSTFNVGEKPYYINMIDSDGVTFLGIKMLNEQIDELPQEREVEVVEQEIEKEKKALEDMERRINELYEELDNH